MGVAGAADDADSADGPDDSPAERSGLAVFDVDGVVADVRHRLHHLDRGAWHRFFVAADRDPLLPEGARLVEDLGSRHHIVWLTGRPEWLRSVTEKWFADAGLPPGELFMRDDGDYRPAAMYKMSVLRRLAPRGVMALVDDDDEVVRAALRAGFRRSWPTGCRARQRCAGLRIETAVPNVRFIRMLCLGKITIKHGSHMWRRSRCSIICTEPEHRCWTS